MVTSKAEFFLVDADYVITGDGVTQVRLFGRDDAGRTVIALCEKFLPYFYMLPKHSPKQLIEQLEGINLGGKGFEKLEVVEKLYNGKTVEAVKGTVRAPPEVPIFRELVRKCGELEERLETDVPFVKKFMIEHGLAPLGKLLAEGEETQQGGLKADVVIAAEKIKGLEHGELPELKVLSFDIEVYCPKGSPRPRHDPITMISLAGSGMKKVLTWQQDKNSKAPDYVEVLGDEAAVIRRFLEIVEEYDPDVIAGYNSDAFDFPYLRDRSRVHQIRLVLGRDGSEVGFVRRGPSSAATTFGRLLLDVFPFIDNIISRGMKAESLDLNTVAQELLGVGKTGLGYEDMVKKWQEGRLVEMYEYSLKDSVLVEMLSGKLLPMAYEFAKLTRNPIFDAIRMTSGQIVEWVLFSRAYGMNIIAPNHPMREDVISRRSVTYVGGYVRQPEIGLHSNIAVLDYRSLYPSIIISHNIDPSTINCDCCCPSKKEGAHFCSKKKGFIPTVLREVLTKRLELKGLLKKAGKGTIEYRILDARQQALKQVANSFYGYMGFAGARWYCLKCAEATTALGRMYIQQTIDAAEKDGFRVLYADSLPYGRNVFIKTPDGIVRIVSIGDLYDNPISGCQTLAFTKENKAAFVPILRVIRHPFSKEKGTLLKIVTKYGTTIVTDKHSVYTYDNGIRLAEAGTLKKGDYLISLTNIPVEVVYKEGAVFDMADMNLGKYKDQLLLYSDDLEFPAKIGVCPYCKKKTYLSTHVHSRHGERRHRLKKESTFEYVGGTNAKTGKIPRHWTLDEDLAWLLGFYCAEGSLSDSKTGTGRKAMLSFGGQDVSLIKKVKKIIEKKMGFMAKIIKDFDKRINKMMYYYRVQRMPLVPLFQYGFGAGRGSEFKTVPPFIFTSEEKLRKAFLNGYLDGDGTRQADKRYKTHFIRFSTKSKGLAIGLQFLLTSSRHGSNFKGGEIKHVAWQYRKDKPKINTLRLQSAKKSHENFCLADIKSIETAPMEKYVYDLEVEGCHNFVDAEGMLLVHNTDSCFLSTQLESEIEKKAGNFIEQVNRGLPETMELELQGIYRRGVFVTKKRYAMLAGDGSIVVKGLERVRRDWAPIAKDTQEAVLRALLEKADPKEAARIVRDAVKRLRERQVSIGDVTILTQLTKDPDRYELTAPHVEAAKKMIKKGREARAGVLIRFIVKKGRGSISERSYPAEDVSLDEYDPDYYINNQVLPAALRIMEALGFKEAEELKSEQKKLGEFS